ncbi:MAG: TetR/AcrR family transcriptional regulator [Clostridia bacterium]|nr:TetR/AcrR family transcriptional regulator [Clostridia bacterium]
MDQEISARERIMTAFIAKLEEPRPSVKGQALLPQLAKYIDGHFTRVCSFYDRKKLLKNLESDTNYYLSFLAKPTDIERIAVSELTKAAGVNRTTFYKLFPNTTALYDACCEELTQKFLEVPVPADKTPEGMRDYANALWKITAQNETLLFSLSHRVNKRAMPYHVAHRVFAHIDASLSAAERASFAVQENLATGPELFSTWLTQITVEKLAPGLYPNQNLPVYDPSRSLIENIASCFEARYGGNVEFYYNMGIAALRLLSQKRFYDVKLNEFCAAAGYPRSTFYAHFTDFTDYVMKVLDNAVLVCMSAFLYFLEQTETLTPEALRVFRGEMSPYKTDAVRAIFVNGSITYLLGGLFAYLMRCLIAEKEKADGRPCSGEFQALLSFYLAYAMRLFMMNYIGDMTDAELFAKRGELERIKEKLREM